MFGSRCLSVVSLALLGASLVLLGIRQMVFAAAPTPHGTFASGIPYWPGACEESKNYTYHASEHQQAIDYWFLSTVPRAYVCQWQTGDPLHQYMVYTGSSWDTDLANFFGVDSCSDKVAADPSIANFAGFTFGHGNLNSDRRFSVLCFNLAALGFPNGFENWSPAGRVNGVAHEIGHSLHLAHDNHGIMDQCWCKGIDQQEVDVVVWMYASPP